MLQPIFLLSVFGLMSYLAFSCTEKEASLSEKEMYTVCLALKKDVEILPFPSSRSIPAYRPSEPYSAYAEEIIPLFTQIEYLVYHKESGAIVKHLLLTEENSDDFGAYIYDDFEAGEYIVSLLAHSSSAMTLTGSKVASEDVTDSFYAKKEIIVGSGSGNNPIEMLLKRAVSRVEFVGNKIVPQNAVTLVLDINKQYNTVDMETGLAIESRVLRKEFSLLGGSMPEDNLPYSFYTFVPEPLKGDTSYLESIKVTTLDTNQDTLNVIELKAIPILRNRITRYSGSLYVPNSYLNTLELEIEDYGQWKDTIHVPF